jgi:hypothetical protein
MISQCKIMRKYLINSVISYGVAYMSEWFPLLKAVPVQGLAGDSIVRLQCILASDFPVVGTN